MNVEIWRFLAQLLFYRNDLIRAIKPFFENLKNQKENQSSTEETNFALNNINSQIEEIISGNKIKELDKLVQEKDIKTFNTIMKSFLEVKKMEIPLIQYCIMKKAIECFKYLLVNGFDDPNRTMEHLNSGTKIKRYEWDCMATAIYFGNKEIIKILEEKGIEKGKNATHIEAAILSYRNLIAKEIIEDLNENKEQIQQNLNLSLRASAKSNNIKGFEILIFLMNKGTRSKINNRQLNSILNIIYRFFMQ